MLLLDLLTVPVLVAVAFAVGVLAMVFELAFPAVPSGVFARDRLVEANSRLRATASTQDGPARAQMLELSGGTEPGRSAAPPVPAVAAPGQGRSRVYAVMDSEP